MSHCFLVHYVHVRSAEVGEEQTEQKARDLEGASIDQ